MTPDDSEFARTASGKLEADGDYDSRVARDNAGPRGEPPPPRDFERYRDGDVEGASTPSTGGNFERF